ncbi:MAG: Gfo/Idh/MocA family oxidoreductase [Planctomycetes bacterium]|nr:Gfo/Idh/MocA family oxidoreductase [Planctomycetota bacterium]
MKIALIEAGHWHAPLYGQALIQSGVTVCAVSDQDPAASERVAQKFGCPSYPSPEALVEKEGPDLLFAFGVHDEMPGLALRLVEIGVPFVMEKPMGLRWKDVLRVAEAVEARGLYAGVDLVSRCYRLMERLAALRAARELGQVNVFYHRLLAGDPLRYAQWGVPWVIQKTRSGGGCLYNFGPHVLDLFMLLTGEPIESVYCLTSTAVHRLEVEEYAAITARTPSGAIGNLEVGYLCPGGGYERAYSVSTTRLLVSTSNPNGGVIQYRDGRTESLGDEAVDWALLYVRETLRRFQNGEAPVATIRDMARALQAVNAAEESSATGQVVRLAESPQLQAKLRGACGPF